MHIKSVLQASTVFKGASDKNLEYLAAESRTRHFARGEVLMRQGQPGYAAYLLLNGHVRVERQEGSDGPRMLAMLGPGQIVGEMAVLKQTSRTASVLAMGRVTAVELPAKAMRKVVAEEPLVDERLLRTVEKRVTLTSPAIH